MKITLLLVTSVNGKLTNGTSSPIYEWTSTEDRTHFFSLIEKNSLIIMGRKTYEAAKTVIKLEPGKLRVILTRHPEQFDTQSVAGQLEFSKESPKQLLTRLEKADYRKALLVGGSKTAGKFLIENLVTTLLLSIEPILFGTGQQFLQNEELNVQLSLTKVKRLNTRGTLLLNYRINSR